MEKIIKRANIGEYCVLAIPTFKTFKTRDCCFNASFANVTLKLTYCLRTDLEFLKGIKVV